jgi:hypothetical protein
MARFAASTFLSHGCLRSMASMAIHVLRYFTGCTCRVATDPPKSGKRRHFARDVFAALPGTAQTHRDSLLFCWSALKRQPFWSEGSIVWMALRCWTSSRIAHFSRLLRQRKRATSRSATFEDCLSSLTARWNGSFDHPISYFTSPATISTRCRAWSRPSAKPPTPYRGPVYGISRKPVTEVWPVPLKGPGSSDSLTLLLLSAPASERAR